jgi:uncharacterized protein (TIGR00375 family)
MKIVADLHIHSKYSRAVSRDMDLEHIDEWAKKKGIQVMGTGDFTHPDWFGEIKEKMEPAEPGLFVLKNSTEPADKKTRFMLTVEISNIYKKNGRTRRIHNLIFAPSLEAVEKINTQLSWNGNIRADGRPILGMDSKELFKIALNADEKCILIPAHAWTPWFSIFGSMSGFDSIEECFDEFSDKIFAIETGLSSDPLMNWRLSKLDNISLISNSDSHSPQRIGREANVFDSALSYDGIVDAIKSRDPRKFLFTIEFFPEEGMYHWDGHRNCDVSFAPAKTDENSNTCPICKKALTIGVLNRVEKLADRKEDEVSDSAFIKTRIPYKSLVPLDEIIAQALGLAGVKTKGVVAEYENLINNLENELNILMNSSYEEIESVSNKRIAEGIRNLREGRVKLIPGFDGKYGKVIVLDENEKEGLSAPQKTLF